MDKRTNISQKVKQLLSSIKWDYEKGTVKSSDLLKVIAKDKTLSILIDSNDLKDLKQKSLSIEELLNESQVEAKAFNSSLIETPHLLMAVVKLLNTKKYLSIRNQISKLLNFVPLPPSINKKKAVQEEKLLQAIKKDLKKLKKTEEESTPPFLRDINYLAKKGLLTNPVPHPRLEDEIISVVGRKHKNSIVILGAKGSGKTSALVSLSQRIHKGQVPDFLKDARILYVNLGAFSHMLDFKEKFESVFKKMIYSSQNHKFILFLLDDLHLLSQTGFFSFSPPLLDPILNQKAGKKLKKLPRVAFVATLDDTVSDRFLEGPVQDYWEVVRLGPPKKERLKKILKKKSLELKNHYGLSISDYALNYVLDALPTISLEIDAPVIDFGVTLLDDIFSRFSIEQNTLPVKKRSKSVNVSFISTYLKKRYNFDYKKMLDKDLTKKLLGLEEHMKKEIIGQDHAIESLVRTIKRSVLGFSSPNKPKASVLFLGPTGVGKTQTAKVLAKHLFGPKKLVRIDMSDFMEKHTVSRLVGSPPGYVGYGEGGQLTNFVKENKESVVLFDEIEKAHPDVLNILLQILEEGQLTDGEGNIISFKDTVVVLTSNLGAEIINKTPIGFMNKAGYDVNYQEVKDKLLSNLKNKIKPEILNRLNEIVVYNQLKKEDASKILRREIFLLNQRMLKKHKATVKLTPSAFKYVLEKGFSKEYGVRELQRSLERNLVDPVIDFILKNPSKERFLYIKKSKGSKGLSVNYK